MNILHLNTNYEVSSIYPNMFYEFNNFENVIGRLYYPVSTEKVIEDKNKELVDISKCLNKFDRFFYFKRNRKLYSDITRIYNINDFDMTLAYSLFSNGFLAYTLKRKHGIPYVVIVQNTDINLYFKRMLHLRDTGRKILQEANGIVFISKPYKQFLLNKYFNGKSRSNLEKKSYVIPFGIDNFWFNNMNENKTDDPNEIKLLYVGRINKNKNIISTARACNVLINNGYRVTLTIVGQVEDRKLFNKLSKFEFVKYIPYVEIEDLIKIYRENDIFIMPSFKESFGLVYAEAMTQGLPIIYTKGQGFDKHFEEGHVGHSVNPTNINEIVESVIKIKSKYRLYSMNCLRSVEKFRWSSITQCYNKMFRLVGEIK